MARAGHDRDRRAAALRKKGPAARPDRAHPGRRRTDRRATHRRRRGGHAHRAVEEHRRIGAGRHRPHRGVRLHRHDHAAAEAGSSTWRRWSGPSRSRRRSPTPPTPEARRTGRTRSRSARDAHRVAHARGARGEADPSAARDRATTSAARCRRRPAPAAEAGPLRRFYLALPFSPRGRPGPPGTVAELRLTALPEAPAAVTATLVGRCGSPRVGTVGRSHRLSPRPLAAIRAVSARQSATGRPPTSARRSPPDGPTRYNVYREIAAPTPDASPTRRSSQPPRRLPRRSRQAKAEPAGEGVPGADQPAHRSTR